MKLSNKIQSIEGSQTVSFTSLIARLRRDGKKIIDFAVGEPQFDTPSEIIESTKKALAEKKPGTDRLAVSPSSKRGSQHNLADMMRIIY